MKMSKFSSQRNNIHDYALQIVSGIGLFNAADGWGGPGFLNSKSGNILVYVWDLQEHQTSYFTRDLSQVEGEGYLINIADNLTTYTYTNVKVLYLNFLLHVKGICLNCCIKPSYLVNYRR